MTCFTNSRSLIMNLKHNKGEGEFLAPKLANTKHIFNNWTETNNQFTDKNYNRCVINDFNNINSQWQFKLQLTVRNKYKTMDKN